MESDPKLLVGPGPLLRGLRGLALPGLLAAGFLFALAGDPPVEGASPGAGEDSPPPPAACGAWHPGAGETTALDLGAVRRAYADLRSRVARRLADPGDASVPDPAGPYDAGLPACTGEAARTEVLSPARGARFRGRTLYFLRVSDPGRLILPPEVERTAGAEILIVQVRRLKDLPEIARRLGRPVSLAGAPFARALGVRCANTWVRISEKGDGSELHEDR